MFYELILTRTSNLIQEFISIPNGVTSLDLSLNELGNISNAELTQAFQYIPDSVISMDLANNHLCYKSGSELAQLLAAIPANVTSLNLSCNDLHKKSGAELAQAFAAIPASVTSLNLHCNYLGNNRGVELAQAFAATPKNVTSLDLSMNYFDLESSADLSQIFTSIPPHVVSLNLSFNSLHEVPFKKLVLLKDSLKHVQTVYLSFYSVKEMSKEQRKALGSLFPNAQKIILVDDYDNEIQPSITISNLIGELSGKADAPSLLNQCILFAQRNQIDYMKRNIPGELQESIRAFNSR
ncbi:TPA: hypothetical protein I8Z41_001724 [Legionella pneumophila]|nr:hypothetical protein [Legionella pneumophila]HAT9100984.1 hypothetical protein [Legionella pneumophila subsp. pneumophila]HAT1886227.1 hypothetical protein [Legionella pneumophila]HAT9104425.1 hypothetical protein [Legionella pneumophila subsp. pneumophila]HAT9698603.1 hypothetical protein [Legionella pneumophila subsp. pneumophila]